LSDDGGDDDVKEVLR